MPPRLIAIIAATLTSTGWVLTAAVPSAVAATNAPIAQIDVGGGSFTGVVSPDGRTLFVPVDVRDAAGESVEGHLAIIDAASNSVRARVPVGFGPVRTTPDARGGRMFVMNSLSGTVSVVNVARQVTTATIEVGGNPIYGAFIPSRSRLLVAAGPTGQLVVIDTRSNAVINRIELGGNVATVATSSDNRFAYVTNSTLNRMDVLDTETLKIVAQVPTGASPNRAVASPNGRFILVSNWLGNSVTVIDGRTFTVIRELAVGGRPLPAVIAPNARSAWVASADDDSALQIDLTVVRGASDPIMRRVTTGDEPWMLLLNATGSTLYVANRQQQDLTVICTGNGRVATPLATSHPNRWVTGGQAIYVGGAAPAINVLPAAPLKNQRCR